MMKKNKRAHNSQIVGAKETPQLSHGPAKRHALGTRFMSELSSSLRPDPPSCN